MRIAVDSDIFLYAVIDHNRDELRKKDIFPEGTAAAHPAASRRASGAAAKGKYPLPYLFPPK